jgi:hypothetical protein
MSKMFFSKCVLKGLKARGLDLARIGGLVGWTPAEVKAGLGGKRALSDSMLDVIEQETGYSAGQLAAFSVEPEGGPLTEICDELSTVMGPGRRTVAKKAG